MKIKFDPNLDFQKQAIESITGVFEGQEIGRGLRIAVNQDGERVHEFEVNTLTVMANESYEKCAEEIKSYLHWSKSMRLLDNAHFILS